MDIAIPIQRELFKVDRQVERDGIELGVLENGIPYLTESGLARMCGIDRRVLNRLSIEWENRENKPRILAITQLLKNAGYYEPTLYLKSEITTGSTVNAYTEPVCLALLEYYAFQAEDKREQAQNAFRILAKSTFTRYIYTSVGYLSVVDETWKYFHDRVALNYDMVPIGFFSIFKEIAGLFVTMIQNDVPISNKIVPDISVGRAWSDYWKSIDGDVKFSQPREKYKHNYPDYFPQSYSNPQESWCYPNVALGVFRDWFERSYLPIKFPSYMLGLRAKIGTAVVQRAIVAIESLRKPELPPGK